MHVSKALEPALAQKLTLAEGLWILGNDPVARVDIDQLKLGEELANQGDHLVRYVLALRAADKQRGLEEAACAGVLEGEVAHVVERLGKDVERHSELLRLGVVRRAMQVAEEELSDGKGLLQRAEGQSLVSFSG